MKFELFLRFYFEMSANVGYAVYIFGNVEISGAMNIC